MKKKSKQVSYEITSAELYDSIIVKGKEPELLREEYF